MDDDVHPPYRVAQLRLRNSNRRLSLNKTADVRPPFRFPIYPFHVPQRNVEATLVVTVPHMEGCA